MELTLKTPDEWSKQYGLTIKDPDGWRMKDAPSWETPISEYEYAWRMAVSTVEISDKETYMKALRERYKRILKDKEKPA
jgi:hypothetical protein